ncbi:unnamed protein product [Scytosiphon promiscuus]
MSFASQAIKLRGGTGSVKQLPRRLCWYLSAAQGTGVGGGHFRQSIDHSALHILERENKGRLLPESLPWCSWRTHFVTSWCVKRRQGIVYYSFYTVSVCARVCGPPFLLIRRARCFRSWKNRVERTGART